MKFIQMIPDIEEYPILKSAVVIGSSNEADIVLSGGNIKPKHVAVWRIGEMFAVSEWDGATDVLVNGHPIQSGQALWENDELKIADITLKFVADNVTIENIPVQLTPHPPVAATRNFEQWLPVLKKIRERQRWNVWQDAWMSAIMTGGDTVWARWRAVWLLFPRIFRPNRQTTMPFSAESAQIAQIAPTARMVARPDDRLIVETGGTPELFRHDEQSLMAAWVFLSITTIFNYDLLLQNNWLEESFFVWLRAGIAESVFQRCVGDCDDGTRASLKKTQQWLASQRERMDIEIAQINDELGVHSMFQQWQAKRPFSKPVYFPHKTFAQYRQDVFLKFLSAHGKEIPRQIGAYIWTQYYRQSAEILPNFQREKSLLQKISPEKRETIPLWQAKVAVRVADRLYFFEVVKHDARNRVLAFLPGKPEDAGEPLALVEDGAGAWIDQKGRSIDIDAAGTVRITLANGKTIRKKLRPTSAGEVKAGIAAVVRERDIFQRGEPSPPHTHGISAPNALVILHFSTKQPGAFAKTTALESSAVAPLHIFVFRQRTQFLFHPKWVDARWAAELSQHFARESEYIWQTMQQTRPTSMLRLPKIVLQPDESAADAGNISSGDAVATEELQAAQENLHQLGVDSSISQLLMLFHSLFWASYAEKRARIFPKTLVFPETQGKFPTDFERAFILPHNVLKIWPEYEKFTNDAVSPTALLLKLRQSLAFIDMLTTAVTGEKALASAAIPFLETWDSPADALKQLPRHLRSVNDVRRCDELLRLWGTTQTSPSIVRMSFGRDAEFSRKLVWSVCLVGQGRVVVSLRDMRPQTHQHLIMGEYDAANAQTQSLLNDYISAMKQFVETLSILKEG